MHTLIYVVFQIKHALFSLEFPFILQKSVDLVKEGMFLMAMQKVSKSD